MTEFRITKYAPDMRLPDGSFGIETWTSVSDIGRTFQGRVFTSTEYIAIESAYVAAVQLFMDACGVDSLTCNDLELHDNSEGSSRLPPELRLTSEWFPTEGTCVSGRGLDNLVRLALREYLWCRLDGPSGFFVHFGYDFYMYIGTGTVEYSPHISPPLFVEECRSPYHRDYDD